MDISARNAAGKCHSGPNYCGERPIVVLAALMLVVFWTPVQARSLPPGDTVIAGVAWQPHAGVSAVEVQVDGGPWQRAELAPASGFQSVQFREIEFLSGAKDPAYLERLRDANAGERDRMAARLAEPSLWDGFVHLLGKAGFDVSTEETRREGLLAVSRDRAAYGPLWDLSEALIQHDSMWARWRSRHVLMVERQIGTKSGTGGSTGAPYLRRRLDLRFFPELWDLRSYL